MTKLISVSTWQSLLLADNLKYLGQTSDLQQIPM